MNCPCGKEFTTTAGYSYLLRRFYGETVVFEICSHGAIILDNCSNEQKKLWKEFDNIYLEKQ